MLTPVLLSPTNGQQSVGILSTIVWEPISEPGKAQVQISEYADFRDLSMDVETMGFGVSMLDMLYQAGHYILIWGRTYWWRMRYQVAGEVWGPWSSAWSFRTEEKAPLFIPIRHRAAAQALMLSQFSEEEAPKLNALIKAFGRQLQDIDDTIMAIGISRVLQYANKAQLDIIGEIVGEPRNSIDDATYRDAIQVRIFKNNSGGTPEEMTKIARILSGASSVQYLDVGPAQYRLVIGMAVPDGLQETIQALSPGGVRLLGIHNTWPLLPFRVGDRVGQRLMHE